ncbi:MAG: septum formation initiator family protein [Desulfobacterales bacterium]|nr:septum formation initiator family protein [Desulfobacterales bacterium]
MSPKEKILLSISLLLLLSLLLPILFGDNGFVDLNRLKKEKRHWIEKNNRLTHRNLSLYREIDRLKNDPKLIENVARQELGMIGENEVIFKLKK